MKDMMQDRKKALENEFFDKQNRQLLERLRAAGERAADREALARACGVADEHLLDQLLTHGVEAETLAALVLVPLVMVAWADAEVAWSERKKILALASEQGILEGSAPAALLEHWLKERPAPGLLKVWSDYVAILLDRLDEAGRKQLADSTLERARAVAKAAGGLLGVGPKVSREEKLVLDRLAAAFEVD